ncbi:MAG: WYL domain-containing protein [Erysipelotrichaceae bacterium]|nr:WYL domain-containing protein [Erysipelotrichaceae bacterium]
MEEKIKIYITKETMNILLKDMELFEFYKKDGTLNKNDFINTLIVNYYERYHQSNQQLYDQIKSTLCAKSHCEDYEINDVAYDILQLVEVKANRLESAKYDTLLSLKPTKKSSSVINYIQQCLLQGSTMSNYFRNMFTSYSLLPQDKREQIIFKEVYEQLKEAIALKRKIYFTTTNNATKHIISPYALSNSKEELFNYLLAEYDDKAYSFRISRITKVVILNEESKISNDVKRVLDKMMQYGPQFAITQEQEICVELTERGMQMFKRVYLHRPKPVRIEGNRYYFECSTNQIFQYFFRYGKHAYVVSPRGMQDEMERNYHMALRMYQRRKHSKDVQ